MENVIKQITRLEMKAIQDKSSELFSSEFAFQATVPVRTCIQQDTRSLLIIIYSVSDFNAEFSIIKY